MPHAPDASRIDERLSRLLEVERRLEARVREGEQAAARAVAAAREQARQGREDRTADLEATARAEEAREHERHVAELGRIAEEGAVGIARLAAVSASVVDALALRVVAIVLEPEEARRP